MPAREPGVAHRLSWRVPKRPAAARRSLVRSGFAVQTQAGCMNLLPQRIPTAALAWEHMPRERHRRRPWRGLAAGRLHAHAPAWVHKESEADFRHRSSRPVGPVRQAAPAAPGARHGQRDRRDVELFLMGYSYTSSPLLTPGANAVFPELRMLLLCCFCTGMDSACREFSVGRHYAVSATQETRGRWIRAAPT
jgi:hypothetical protein